METRILNTSEKPFLELQDIFSVSVATEYMYEQNIGILVILEYIKARDWPWKGNILVNEPVEQIPLVWAVFDAVNRNTLRMVWDVHPAKCFPQLFNRYNPHARRNTLPIVKEDNVTLAGCARTYVNISNRRYEVNEKTPEYCSIFGLPDDCFDSDFEKRMITKLSEYNSLELWCFERTEYIANKVEPSVNLHFMKGDFLPPRYYIYIDTPEHFLKAVFSSRELEDLSSELWYTAGKELIDEMNLDNEGFGFRFEEQALYYLRKRLTYEFVRLFLLLHRRESFASIQVSSSPVLYLDREEEIRARLGEIIHKERKDKEIYIHQLISKLSKYINFSLFRSSRFLLMDIEYIHVPYPTDTSRFFNFPCVFSNIIWRGARDGLGSSVNIFVLPCHFCAQPCDFIRRKVFNYNCLLHGFDFMEKQGALVEGLLSSYDGLKIYTYGRSDVFQLEQGRDFFSDTFERLRYTRRNRKRAQRIIDISEDLSVQDKGLGEIEKEVLEPWLIGWSRKEPKVNFNTRFMTRYGQSNWETRYSEAISSCMLDAISALAFLLYRKYRLTDDAIKYNAQNTKESQ